MMPQFLKRLTIYSVCSVDSMFIPKYCKKKYSKQSHLILGQLATFKTKVYKQRLENTFVFGCECNKRGSQTMRHLIRWLHLIAATQFLTSDDSIFFSETHLLFGNWQ